MAGLAPKVSSAAFERRRIRGAQASFQGACAEDSVARWYKARGGDILERRWRGTAGEIDLIIRLGGVVVFCEVKSSRNQESAAYALTERQISRICQTAEEYLGKLPEGQLTEVRFDLALVGMTGKTEVLQNAFGHS